jgi:hypothetical protein
LPSSTILLAIDSQNIFRLKRMMSAYTSSSPFSLSLLPAVLRQSSFVSKMADLGWTHPSYFSHPEDERVLQHAVGRYMGFLDLMASEEGKGKMLVPTLDIDLVWHTHQLLTAGYHSDCKQFVGRYIDQ